MRIGPDCRHVVLLGEIYGELSEEQYDVRSPLAERRHPDRHRVEPVEKILAELTVFHGLGDVDVTGRYDPDVGFLVF